MKYRVVWVTNNLEIHPECKEANEEFPHMIEYVEDDSDGFVVNEEGRFWAVREFFMMKNIPEFETPEPVPEWGKGWTAVVIVAGADNVARYQNLVNRYFKEQFIRDWIPSLVDMTAAYEYREPDVNLMKKLIDVLKIKCEIRIVSLSGDLLESESFGGP